MIDSKNPPANAVSDWRMYKLRNVSETAEWAADVIERLQSELDACRDELSAREAELAKQKALVGELVDALKELHSETLYRISPDDCRDERPSSDLYNKVTQILAKAQEAQ